MNEQPPSGWPLKRPLTSQEWGTIVRVLILRRLSEHVPVELATVCKAVAEDTRAAEPKLYGAGYAMAPDTVESVIEYLVKTGRAVIVSLGPDPNRDGFDLLGVMATAQSRDYRKTLSAPVRAVLRYLPYTNLLDAIALAAAGPDE